MHAHTSITHSHIHTHTHTHREVCRLRKAKQRADIKKAVEILNSMDNKHAREEPESTIQEES